GREGGGAKRKQLEETLKDLEKQKKQMNRPPLSKRLQRSGLSWGVRTFILFSVGCGFIFLVIGLLANAPIWALPVLVFAGGFGFPRWFLGFVTTRRQNKFLNEFPNAVDVIVRGIKAGLPLNDCLRMIATEAAEPVKTEFRQTIEAQAMGLSTSECVQRIYERMPLPEVNFFTIVIAIQQRSGGNLAEALGNLSKVLRDRKKMKGKIVALSQEAKASAAIIGALPIVVMILIFITSPDYISLLWTEELGHIMLAGCAFWMFCGVLVMRKMINFKF
ncbi:MAG: type II secretion system F family protein, partial [Pseudomonadota bacterium]